ILSMLLEKLEAYNETVVPPVDDTLDPRGAPEYHDGVWAPWVSFHCIPDDSSLRKRWLAAIKREPPFNIRTARVCSRHFNEEDFLKNIVSGRRMLQENAVPSVFAFKKAIKKRKPPKARPAPTMKNPLRAMFVQDTVDKDTAIAENSENIEQGMLPDACEDAEPPCDFEALLQQHTAQLQNELAQAKAKIAKLEERVCLLMQRCSYLEKAAAQFLH
ncbi:THAP domain-containing protein 1-like, partial [Rhipicephalus sanguineus]|uniref:THAP domain-containing protein 1-like n=1 Tax=Rhipicephalus sanguineus TaxID=34632 RepID=UPI0018950943